MMQFFQRGFPSANMVLLPGTHPILVDSGHGCDFEETLPLLKSANVNPQDLQMVVNTHYHCDHVGGNHAFMARYQIPIATHQWEAQMVNRRDRDACSAEWLDQAVEPYRVTHMLKDGDVLDTGTRQYQVIHTPGHTLGHICIYSDGELVGGDTVHADDIAWLNIFREGAGAIYRILETLERLEKLPLRVIYSGHGTANYEPHKRIQDARARYEKWIDDPHKIGWHACKRIFTYALMLFNGLSQAEIPGYLLRCPWFNDYSRFVFDTEPANFVQPLLDELIRSGAAYWQDDILLPTASFKSLPPGWLKSVPKPLNW